MRKIDDGPDVEREKPKKLFPMPPEFYRFYSAEHVRLGTCPPPPPVPPKFTVFGQDYDLEGPLVTPLEARGTSRLYGKFSTMNDIRIEMKKINNSIMAAFLDLVQILIDCPESKDRGEKLEHLRTLFLNFHQLINELRPVEARHCLFTIQQQQSIHQLELHAKIQNSMSLAQAVVLGIQHMAEKMPELPLPENLPKIEGNIFKENPKIDHFQWILEDATNSKADTTLLNSLKRAKSDVDEEGYILKYWREPPRVFRKPRIKNSMKTRDKVVRLKTSKEFSTKKRLKSPPPPDVRFLQRKEAGNSEVLDNQDVEMDEGAQNLNLESAPSPEEKEVVIRREIAEEKIPKVSDRPYYSQESFGDYVKSRGVAPDLDREIQGIKKLKSQLTNIFTQKQVEKDSDEETSSEEPQPSSSKVDPLEVVDVDPNLVKNLKKTKSKQIKANGLKIQYIPGLSDSSDLSEDSESESTNLVSLHNVLLSVLQKPKKIEKDFQNPKHPGSTFSKSIPDDVIIHDDEGPKLIPIQKETASSTDSRGIPILEEEAEEDDRQFQNLRNPSGEEPPPILEIQKRP
ncbi:hypothetical protein FO519_008265 [Halicephalobus sp. NKZ332]|nr:hypothetical protein FO519_008265 [Halicephalobus sp. NKZ332]